MTWTGIAENLISNIISALTVILLGWVLFLLTHRIKLLKFFGIYSSRRIVVYTSNLRVKRFGAIGIDGQPRSYGGSAIGWGEAHITNHFRDLFNYLLPSLSDRPGILSKLLISDVQVQIQPSSLHKGQIEASSSFISLGGPAYNYASILIETDFHSQARFQPSQIYLQDSIEPSTETTQTTATTQTTTTSSTSASSLTRTSISPSAPRVSSSITCLPPEGPDPQSQPKSGLSAIWVEGISPITDTTYGFVERIVDHKHRRCIFYAAGLSELGTVGAAYHLATKWSHLYDKYGEDTPFLRMLRFEPSDYRHSTIVFER